MIDFSSEGLTDKLEYSDRVKIEAKNKLAAYDAKRQTSSRSLIIADIKDGQRVVRRWCGNKNDDSILMQTIKIGF